MPSRPGDYEALLAEGEAAHPGIKLGRPGKGWLYPALHPVFQLLRAKWRVSVTGAENVRNGPAILVGNHLHAMDPILTGMATSFRLVFFAKADLWETKGAFFFWGTGQIPIVRGDEASTKWGLAVSSHALALGNKLCLYPEGTRSADGKSMYRLHRRVLVPVLQANPGVPVHAMSIAYGEKHGGRQDVDLRFSPALPLDPEVMSANDLTEAATNAILELGGMPYIHQFGRHDG